MALIVLALAGSCVSRDTPTGVGGALAPAGVLFQPSVIPSPANDDALPINRIRLVAVRNADDAVLADSSFSVPPTDTAWSLDFRVSLTSSPTTARVYVYLVNVPASGPPAVQFSGVTETLTLRARETVTAPDFPLVRGPLDNLLVTGVTITSTTPSVPQGLTVPLAAAVSTSSSTANPVVFWTSLDTTVVRMVGSLASGVVVGTADVVATAGAFSDTVTVTVLPPVDSLLVSPDSAEVSVGGTTTYTAATFDASGNPLTGRLVTWSTASPAVATVSATGVVTGVSEGSTSVIATSEGVSDTAKVVVLPPVAGSGGQNRWTASSGLWSTPANWSLGRVPIAEDTVLIDQGGDYSVTLDTNVTVSGIVVDGVTDLITLDVGGYDLTVDDGASGGTLSLRSWGNLASASATVTAPIVTVDDSASVLAVGTTVLGSRDVTNDGLWTLVADGTLTVELGGTSPVITNNGTITVGAAATLAVVNLSDAQIINAATGVLEGSGTVDFTAGNPQGVNNGIIAPGLSGPGMLAWAGTVPMGPTGSIDIELGGTTPGTGYDQLNVGVNLGLFGNGTLNVDTINGFVPSPGDRFGIITTPASDLDFATVNLPSIPGLTFSTIWSADGTTDTLFVEVAAAPAGTLNRWQSATSGNWSAAANWSLNRVPQAGDSVVIDVDGTYTVTIDQPADAQWISLGAATGAQTLVNTGWTVSSLTGMDIGANGTFSIPGGGSLSGSGMLTNTGIVSMGGGTIINALGVDNSGTWTILPGGSVTQNAAVTNSGTMQFFHNSGLTAMALAGDLTNTGTITLEDSVGLGGPDLRVNSGTLYNLAAGLIQTTGPGTTSFIRGPIYNEGTITTTGNVQMGNTPTFGVTHNNIGNIGGTARIAWTNVDSFVNSGTYDGSAEVDMTFTGNGAGFVNAGEVTTGVGSSLIGGSGVNLASGVLTVANGVLDLSTDVFANEGLVDVASGATLAMANDVTLAPGATLSGSGTVDNTFTTAGVLAGDVAPGGVGQIGTLSWIGDYEPGSTSMVLIELGGVGNGESDLLEITGQTDGGFTFAGALVLQTLAYAPSLGDTIPVIVFDERSTPFESVTFPSVSGVTLDTLWSANAGLANPDTLYIVAKPLPLALSSDRAGNGDRDIWLTSKDGTSSIPLTSSADNDRGPRWSPDGGQIAFTRQPSSGGQLEIWTMDANGANATRRTPGVTQSDSEPAWSPDGTRIVYTHNAGQSQDLWYMNKDGSGQTELTVEPGFDESQPSWSPTADSIVFVSNLQGLDDIWVMDFQNPNFATAITVDAGNNEQPQYSPDGSQIVFSSDRTGNFEIWLMNRDGSSPQQLTNDLGADGFPTWSPDGTQIYFASDRTGDFEIWVMDKDGSNPMQVSVAPGVDDGPDALF